MSTALPAFPSHRSGPAKNSSHTFPLCDKLGPMTKLSRDALEKVAASFRALSEPTRLQILQELRTAPRTVSDLVDSLQQSQANVSRQLSVLRGAGFLAREQKGNQAFYSICDPLVLELCNLVCGRLGERALADADAFRSQVEPV